MNDGLRRWNQQIDGKIANKKWIRHALVSKVRKSDKKIRVKLLPEKIETNWLRVYYINNLGSGQMPLVDQEVVLLLIEGEMDAAFVLAGGFLDDDITAPNGEGDIEILDKYGGKIIMQDGKIIIDSGVIELGEGATEKAILGTTFQTYFNTHIHPTPMGPSGPPTVTSTPDHLSNTVKVKA